MTWHKPRYHVCRGDAHALARAHATQAAHKGEDAPNKSMKSSTLRQAIRLENATRVGQAGLHNTESLTLIPIHH